MHTQDELLVEASRLYYEEQLTQAEIGRRLHTSRSTVSRLLQEARSSGVVKIIINYPWKRNYKLEQALMRQFQLREVLVLRSQERPLPEVMRGMGLLAAQYLDGFVQEGVVLGVSYGRSIAAMINQLNPARKVDMTIVQILGALGSGNPLIEGPDLVRELANAYQAQYRYLHTPMIVEGSQIKDFLIQEPSVRDVLSLGKKADAVVLGIGAHTKEASGLIWTGYVNPKELAFLRSRGGVGHMCAQHFDINGQVLDVELNQRVISIGIKALREIETVIAIAGSEEKATAIFGALNGRYIDILVTDDQAAQKVLQLAEHTAT